MNTKRRAATPLALGGLLQATIGTVFTVAESKDFGAPLFGGGAVLQETAQACRRLPVTTRLTAAIQVDSSKKPSMESTPNMTLL